jgi:uncharacterized protein (DUF58 family)
MSGPAADTGTPPDYSQDLPYRIAWRGTGLHPGAHSGSASGSGGLFRDLTLLTEQPDPRRIDLRSSMRDPLGQLYVRRFELRTAISIYVLADVSASMGFTGNMRKLDIIATLCAALAATARRIGDKFGLIGCGSEIVPELLFPAARSRSGEIRMIEALRTFRPAGRGTMGLADAAYHIGATRKLVVLISDFHMPEAELIQIFEALARHDVRPVVLADSGELDGLPAWGILPLADLETGRRRLIFLRPKLKAAWLEERDKQERSLQRIAARFSARPFKIMDRIDWDQLSTYLMEAGA